MFVVKNKDLAKQVAAKLKSKLHDFGYEIGHVKCLDLLARMYGHSDWKGMEDAGKALPASALDEESPEQEVIARRQTQLSALRDFGVKEAVLSPLLDNVRPTARRTLLDPLKIDDAEAEALIELAREVDRNGDAAQAASLLTHAIAHGPRRSRVAVVEELERLSSRNTTACYSLGIANLIGDAPGGKNIDTARRYFERCIALQAGDEPTSMSYCALGDIVGGLHGGPADEEASLRLYLTAAFSGKSGDGAFNAAIQYERRNLKDIAASLYRMGAVNMHAGCMTNLAMLMVEEKTEGGIEDVTRLLEIASSLGDAKASNALRNIDSLMFKMAMPSELSAFFGALEPPDRLIRIMPIKIWLKVLTQHGWELTNVRTGLDDELDVFATTQLPDGRSINLHACLALAVAGGDKGKEAKNFHRRFGFQDGILIYQRVKPIAEGKSADVVHLCIGQMHLDGRWSDIFLEEGGAAALLEQRRAMEANPKLDRSLVFRCARAEAISAQIEEANMRAIDKWSGSF